MFTATDEWYYAGALILRSRRGKLTGLIMKTVKRAGSDAGRVLHQLPGGMEELSDNGNPIKTLDRELGQETGFRLREDHKVDPPLLHKEMTKAEHFRYFYLLWRNDLRGALHTGPVEDRAKIILELKWEELGFFEENLCQSQRKVWEAFKAQYPYLWKLAA